MSGCVAANFPLLSGYSVMSDITGLYRAAAIVPSPAPKLSRSVALESRAGRAAQHRQDEDRAS